MALKAKLHIETALRSEKTFLKKSFCTPPFKIADVTEDKKQKSLQLMMMNSSPGVLDEDEYCIRIDVAENTSLQLQTQSYQRLFQMKKGAVQTMEVNLEQGASFVYLPHPSVPHQNSIFLSRNKIYLQNNYSLVWGEVISCGRKLNGEVFQFTSYHSITEIFLNSKLVVKENLLLKPATMNLSLIGQLEGYTHQATLLYLNEEANVTQLTNCLIENLNEQVSTADATFGVSALPVNGIVVRLLGYKAEQLFHILKSITTTIFTINEKVKPKPEMYVI